MIEPQMDAGNVEENVVDVGENNLARMDHVNNNRDERRNEVGDPDDQGANMRVIVRFL